jgi:hypothetical protein
MTDKLLEQVREALPADVFTVNFVRLAGLSKDKARECEEIVRTLLDAALSSVEAALQRPAQAEPQGCHRSHPHENMGAECERLTVTARENNARAGAALQQEGGGVPPSATDILGAVARGWTHAQNQKKEMDPDLAIAIAAEVSALLEWPRPSDSKTQAAPSPTKQEEKRG